MNQEISPEQLDDKIHEMMQGKTGIAANGPLLAIAGELCLLPSTAFREHLRKELVETAEASVSEARVSDAEVPLRDSDLIPTLGQQSYSALPADPRSLFLSFLSHAAAVVLIASGIWAGPHIVAKRSAHVSELSYLPIPAGDKAPHGGGGGGDHDTTPATRGTPPKFSEQQLAPPAIVVRSDNPKLQVQPTVLGPPQVKLPQSERIGDLMSHNVVIPSNGTGGRGGMGSNSGPGLGGGDGAGVGPGTRAGFGGEAYRPGNGVSAPRVIYDPDPEFSDEARRAKYQGSVMLSLIVDPSGRAKDIHVARSLGMGLDEKAIEAVEKWRFAPGMKDGHAVATEVDIEVNFRLY